MSYRTEEILEKLQRGEIDDFEARRDLERELGNCSCMQSHIQDAVRHAEWGFDAWSEARHLDSEKQQCDLRERWRE